MGSGRKPIPTAMKKAKGTAQKCRILRNEMQAELLDAVPDPPEWLEGDDAIREWFVVCNELMKSKVLATSDLSILGMYCTELATYILAQKRMRENEANRVLTKNDKEGKAHYSQLQAWAKVANEAQDRVLKIAAEFGITPSSRTRIGTLKNDDNDPFATLMKKAKANN